MVIRIVTKIYPLGPLGHARPLQEISSKSVHNFFSYPMDRQTDRQTDTQTKVTRSSAIAGRPCDAKACQG